MQWVNFLSVLLLTTLFSNKHVEQLKAVASVLTVCFLLNFLHPGFMPVTHKHPQFIRDPNISAIKHLD